MNNDEGIRKKRIIIKKINMYKKSIFTPILSSTRYFFPFLPAGLMNAADYYGLDELRKGCSGFVQCCINVDTVCALLASAERYIQYKCTKSMVQKVRIRWMER